MSLKLVLFDLDGTLLPMDQDVFVKAYFGALAKALAPHGYQPDTLISAIWAGTKAMIQNDGSATNEQAFWRTFCSLYGEKAQQDEPLFDAFYHRDFQAVQAVCGCNADAAETVRHIRKKGLRVALATNPIFPAIATESRIRWAGLQPSDFERYTTYENSRYCKPNLDYYRAILETLNVTAEECLMVGNDVGEDMIAEALGMQVFLLTDCLINKTNRTVDEFPHGTFANLITFIDERT